jgi:hypothetical protein
MKIWKKNMVAAAVLVTVCAGIYVNWLYTQENTATDLTDTLDTEKVMSEDLLALDDQITLTDGSLETTASDYFAAVRLSRQEARDSAVNLLQEAMSYSDSTKAAESSATLDEIVQTALGFQQHQNPPVTLGKIEPHKSVFQVIGNVQNFGVMLFVGNMTAGKNRHNFILGRIFPAVHHGMAVGNGTGNVNMTFGNAPGTQVGVFVLPEGIVGGAGREVLVIQDPDTHALFSAVIEDKPHIGPPFFPAEILVGTGLQADGTDTAVIDPVQFPDDQGIVLTVKPQEGCHVVMLFAA